MEMLLLTVVKRVNTPMEPLLNPFVTVNSDTRTLYDTLIDSCDRGKKKTGDLTVLQQGDVSRPRQRRNSFGSLSFRQALCWI